MNKKLSLGLIITSIALALGSAAGALAFANKQAKPVEASTRTNFTTVYFDVVESAARFYTIADQDPQTVYYSSMTQITSDSDFRTNYTSGLIESGNTFSVTLRDSKQFDAIYFPVRCYVPNVPAYSTVDFRTMTMSFSLIKNASGGAAPAYAEVFDQDESWTPNAFSISQNTQSTNSVVHLRTTEKNTSVSQMYSFQNITKYNTAGNQNHIWFSFGVLLVGCYGSSYSNHAQITATMSTVTGNYETNDVRVIHSNSSIDMFTEENIHNAISSYNNNPGSTFQLLNDVTVTSTLASYYTFSANGTIDLNGHTFTKNATAVGMSITNNSTVTIKGGTLTHSQNYHTLTIGDGCSVTINSGTSIINTSYNNAISNSGNCNFYGTARSTNGAVINNQAGATITVGAGASLVSQGKDSTDISRPCIINYGVAYVANCSFSIYNNNHACISNQSSGTLYVYGNSFTNLNHISCVIGAETRLYYGSTRYSGSAIKFSFYATSSATSLQTFNGEQGLVYLKNSSDSVYVNLQNPLASYIHTETQTVSASVYLFKTAYTKYSLSITANNCTATPSATTNLIYTDVVTIPVTLNTGYVLSNANITRTGTCNLSFDKDTGVITLRNIASNINLTISPDLQTLTLRYDGNGTNSYTSKVGSDGYIKTNPTYSVSYGSEVTVLENAFRRDGYLFTGWNTEENGTGETYHAGDTFVMTAGVVLYAQWIDVDYAILDDFVNNYMHMSYIQNLGYCKSYNDGDGYYVIAKRELVTYDENTITVFRTDTRYYSARTRYEAWAAINNDLDYAYVNDFSHISSSNNTGLKVMENNTIVIVVTTVVAASSICFAALILLKRRRKHN